MRGCWIQTASGYKFWPFVPRGKDVKLEDIAHSLGHLCRFNGHCRRFYSVAEHSIHVAKVCVGLLPNTQRELGSVLVRQALLHDAAEAYFGDIPTPIKKRLPVFHLEKGILRCIYNKLLQRPINDVFQKIVERADLIMLATEKRDLMVDGPDWDIELPEPAKFCVMHTDGNGLGYAEYWLRAWHNAEDFAEEKDGGWL